MIKKLCFMAVVMALASISSAHITQVHSAAEMTANDYIDWKQFGPNGTIVNSGAHGVTANGIGFTLYSFYVGQFESVPAFQVHTQGQDFNGLFEPGATVIQLYLHNNDWHAPTHSTRIVFDTKVAGIGGFFSPGVNLSYGAVTWGIPNPKPEDRAMIDNVSDKNVALPLPHIPYLGMLDDKLDLDLYTEINTVALTDGKGQVLSNLDIRDNAPAVPEPASMIALGLGVAALIRKRSKR